MVFSTINLNKNHSHYGLGVYKLQVMINRNHQFSLKINDCVNILHFSLGPIMRTLKYMVLALIFLLLLATVIGFLLPSKVEMQRSVSIERSPEKIFTVLNSLKNFNNWSPWAEKDEQARFTFSGPDYGVGSKMTWQGNNQIGQGYQEIIESVENDFVKSKIFFGTSSQPALATLSLNLENDKTIVTWKFENDAGNNLLARYFGLATEDLLAPDYEKGLNKLKIYVESMPLFEYSNISVIEAPLQKVYQVVGQSSMEQAQMSAAIAKSYAKIVSFLSEKNIAMNGSPKIINKKYQDNTYQFIAAIPVDNNDISDDSDEVFASNMPQGKVIKLIHKGGYDGLAESYKKLNAFIYEKKLIVNGSSWEDYVTDPSLVEDSDLITHIFQPIK
jgi:effector-binding domain-containing protein